MSERISNITQIVSAVAIVASLVFVGVQVNQNSQLITDQEDSANWEPWLTINQMAVTSTDFAEIYVRAQEGGLSALTAPEEFRFRQYFLAMFTLFEQNFRASQRDPTLLDRSVLKLTIDVSLKHEDGMKNLGSREWWAISQHDYQPKFVAWVNDSVTD
jgi:hypothetical protein